MGGGQTKRHQMTQETERQRNNMAHKARMEELANIRYQREEKAKSERLENKRKHEQALEKLQHEAEEKQRQHKLEMEKIKQQQKDKAISSLENKVRQCDSAISQDQGILGNLQNDLNNLNAGFKELTEEKKEFNEKRKTDITEWKRKNQYDDILKKLQRAKDEINQAIEKTSLLESNVGKFLHLTQGLVDITTSNQVNAIKLSTIIEVFGNTLERETQPIITIDSFFKLKKWRLDRLIEPLKEETYEILEDCECEDEDEYNELVDLLNEKLDKNLKSLEKKKLKKICLNSEKTWKKDNDDKIKLTKKSLTKMAPVLAKFFNCMYDTMKVTDKILSIEPTLNNEQQNAIEDYQNYKIKYDNMNLKQIKSSNDTDNSNKKNTTNDEEIKEDIEVTKNDENEEKDDFESVNDKLEDDLNNNDKNINKLQLEKVLNKNDKKMVVETQMLTQAAVVSIHVIQSMEDEFKNIEDDRALNLAIGIQDACMKIVRSQGQIRQSIVLAKKILALKPSNLKDKSKKLWDAVDSGVIQIYQSVLTLTKTSAKFFGYFLNFNNSFTRFLKAQEENCSLLVSTEYLQKDVTKFQEFSKELETNVKLLGDEAIKVIRECITNGAGAEIFEKAQEEREKYQKIFDELQKRYIVEEIKWDQKKR